MLRGPAHRGDADAPGPARPGQLLDGLLDGPLALVQELPLAGGLVARDVAGRLQRGERRLDPFAQRGDLGVEPADQQLGEGLGHARNPGDALQQPQDLEDPGGGDGRAGHPLVGIADRAHARSAEVLLRQQIVLDRVEDLVEADDDAELRVGHILQRLHDDGDHRAHAAGEAEAGDDLEGVLGESDLVGEERVAVDERPLAHRREMAARPDVGELRDGALVRLEERAQRGLLRRALLQDAFGDDLVDLVGDEVGLEIEARVQAAHQGGLEVRAVDHLLEVLLAGDDQPDPALALVAEHLGQAVELADALGRVADEGPHLVDHEHQVPDPAVGRRLRLDPGDELVGDALGRDLLVPEHVAEGLLRRWAVAVLGRVHLREDRGQPPPHGQEVVAPLRAPPGGAELGLVGVRQRVEQAAPPQALFDAGDDEVLGEPGLPVELREEDLAHRVGVVQRLPALDLEGDGAHLGAELHFPQPQPHVAAARGVGEVADEGVVTRVARAVGERIVLQEVAEHLGEMRLPRPEEAGDPHAHHVAGAAAAPQRLADLGEGVEDALQLLLDLVGDDVLAQLGGEGRPVEDLHDAFDLPAQVPLDDRPDCRHLRPSPAAPRPVQRQNSLTAR